MPWRFFWWTKKNILFGLSSCLAIYFKYKHLRKCHNFCPTDLKIETWPIYWPMSSYTYPLCPISDITAVFSSESIAKGILESLFIFKFAITV